VKTNTNTAESSRKMDWGRELLARAAADFPAAFGGKPVPLAIGISCILVDAWPDVPRWRVKRWLSDHCASRSYLLAVAAGGPRYYVDGSIDGEVTPDQQEHARQLLEARQQRNLAQFQATLGRLKLERRQRCEAAFQSGLAAEAGRAERPSAPPPAKQETLPAAEAFAPKPAEPQRPAQPVLRAGTVQVRGADRKVRDVQVVKVAARKKFTLGNRESASRS